MPKNPKYLSIKEACDLLGISRPTFDKIRKQRNLKELIQGKRPRFLREEIEKISEPKPVAKLPPDNRVDLTIDEAAKISDIETSPDVFDLTKIRHFDPHGVLNLFCAIVHRGRTGRTVQLVVEDNFICNHLRSLGFFNQLESAVPGRILWSRETLRTDHSDYKYPIGLTKISLPKEEVPIVVKLIELLRSQGFSEFIGSYIAWIFGELTDNANTHLRYGGELTGNTECYLLAQRFTFTGGGSECLIIGIADVGPGIHATLKRNPKHAALSDRDAFLSAFKLRVSGWSDDYKRGRGLTDVFSIAMGNKSIFRAESGGHVFMADFRKKTKKIEFDPNKPQGTRFSMVVIDHDFEMTDPDEVKKYIDDLMTENDN